MSTSIGTLPVSRLAPLEYRQALDAVAVRLAAPVRLVGSMQALEAEIAQRVRLDQDSRAMLWVEPEVSDWAGRLAALSREAGPGTRLAIIISCPLARLVPERRGWPGRPLGLQPGGRGRLSQHLRRAGWQMEEQHALHSLTSIWLNLLSRLADRLGRPELADRLHFLARQLYRRDRGFSTVRLLILVKESNSL